MWSAAFPASSGKTPNGKWSFWTRPKNRSFESAWWGNRWIRPARKDLSGRLKLRIGVGRLKALPKLFRGDEAGADNFAPAPHQRTSPQHLAACGKGSAERLRPSQRADFQANAIVR